jgi:cytochrome c biogenesis protein CcmG, thiol:disulfide interchange protein DsbE
MNRRSTLARRIVPALAVVLVGFFIVLAVSKPRTDSDISSPLIGNAAPAVVSTLVGGGEFDLARRKGSWVVLNFFNSTCVPCRNEHPELVKFAAEQGKIDDGGELVTIVNDDSDGAVTAFFDKHGGDWPKVRDPDGTIAVAFGVAKVPETWVIDPAGFVRMRIAGETTAAFLSTRLQAMRDMYNGVGS